MMENNPRDDNYRNLVEAYKKEHGCIFVPADVDRKFHLWAILGNDFSKEKIEGVLRAFAQWEAKLATLPEEHEDATKNKKEQSVPVDARDEWLLAFNELWTSIHEILGDEDFKKAYEATLQETLEIGKFLASGERG